MAASPSNVSADQVIHEPALFAPLRYGTFESGHDFGYEEDETDFWTYVIAVFYMLVVYSMMYADPTNVCRLWFLIAFALSFVILVEYALLVWLPPFVGKIKAKTEPWELLSADEQRWLGLGEQHKWALLADFVALLTTYMLPQSSRLQRSADLARVQIFCLFQTCFVVVIRYAFQLSVFCQGLTVEEEGILAEEVLAELQEEYDNPPNPSTKANRVTQTEVVLGIEDTRGTVNRLYSGIDIKSPDYEGKQIAEGATVQRITYDTFSRDVWATSPPNINRLIAQLKSAEALTWILTLTFERPGPTDNQKISATYRLTATDGVFRRSRTLRAVNVTKHSIDGLNTIGIGSYGITAVYFFVLVTIGSAVKGFFRGALFQVQYSELPDPDDVLELIEGIYIARAERYIGHLKDEVRIFETLVRVLRSPETLSKVTGTNIIHIPKAKEKIE
ncbi:hypothetical protein P43SY_010201 [Pythium insidiosum]|uniref:Piezo non-specific cation channel cap domain-containing protein n=1 Tax=Pythium insidiosum TaxID=114742 RepID=A0AAD5QE39_PYTIN|nr:hypothetical protein P43SY_010201 [Pythium insidiosum]